MEQTIQRTSYDVIVAGARCAGASTAMLLARTGARVLVVDPSRAGSDTLSTHAIMRAGVLQLHRWGVLDGVRAGGTPPASTTTFHYGDEETRIAIRPRDGVDALYAPRRTLLDALLVDAATAAGAEVLHGRQIVDLRREPGGRVTGARISGPGGREVDVAAGLVIGADGLHSRVARLAHAEPHYSTQHAAAVIYGYWNGVGLDGFHWYYAPGASIGAIPTNGGDTCVFAAMPPSRFEQGRRAGLAQLHREVVTEVSPDLAERLARSPRSHRLRAFAGQPGFLRCSAGPGWALVGDAGYFKDPLTAHGITDALRDAELLARAVLKGTDEALGEYQQTRDELVRGLLDATDRICSFDWDLESVREHHLQLSREMNRESELLLNLPAVPAFAGDAAGVR